MCLDRGCKVWLPEPRGLTWPWAVCPDGGLRSWEMAGGSPGVLRTAGVQQHRGPPTPTRKPTFSDLAWCPRSRDHPAESPGTPGTPPGTPLPKHMVLLQSEVGSFVHQTISGSWGVGRKWVQCNQQGQELGLGAGWGGEDWALSQPTCCRCQGEEGPPGCPS